MGEWGCGSRNGPLRWQDIFKDLREGKRFSKMSDHFVKHITLSLYPGKKTNQVVEGEPNTPPPSWCCPCLLFDYKLEGHKKWGELTPFSFVVQLLGIPHERGKAWHNIASTKTTISYYKIYFVDMQSINAMWLPLDANVKKLIWAIRLYSDWLCDYKDNVSILVSRWGGTEGWGLTWIVK